MPIERELSKIFAMSDADFVQWREDAREYLSEHPDELLQALYLATGQEIVVRAERAWATSASRHPPQ